MLFFFFFQDNEQNGGKKERSYFIPPRWQRPYNLWFIHSPGGNSSIFLPTCMTVPGGHCLPTSVHPEEKKTEVKRKRGKDTTYVRLSFSFSFAHSNTEIPLFGWPEQKETLYFSDDLDDAPLVAFIRKFCPRKWGKQQTTSFYWAPLKHASIEVIRYIP